MATLKGLRRLYRALVPESVRRVVRDAITPRGYSDDYFEYLETLQSGAYAVMAKTLVRQFAPTSVLDVGCGGGGLLVALRELGVRQLKGLDSSPAALRRARGVGLDVAFVDLSKPFVLGSSFDMTVCLEVAEHLPAEAADQFIDCLVAGPSLLVFSAAIPGQGGEGHINEQPPAYWIDKFHHRGFVVDEVESIRIRSAWAEGTAAPWYVQNVRILRRQELERRDGRTRSDSTLD